MEDRRWVVLIFVCLALALVLPMILVHGYAKMRIEKRMSASDLIIALADAICQIVACLNGFGAHLADLDQDFHYLDSPPTHNGNVTEALRVWYLTTLFHILAAASSRTSVGLASISRKAFPSKRRLVSINLIISTAISILFFFLLLFQCTPVPTYWSRDRTAAQAACYTSELMAPWYAFLGVSMAADSVLTCFAVASAMGRRQGPDVGWVGKGITGLFNVVAFSHVASTAIQITYVPALTDLDDLTYSATPFALLALVGPTTALLASHAAKAMPLLFVLKTARRQERLMASAVDGAAAGHGAAAAAAAGSAAGNDDGGGGDKYAVVREMLREGRREERRERGKGMGMGRKSGGGWGGGGEKGGRVRPPGRLVVLKGREGDWDEDAAMAAAVEGGLARLREREGEGGG
ncbi:fmn-dependent dehydrogenase family protein [Diplodia corticola]|uniref:Fmn-dependent dehydrogenase family protein n=1 Tax=Diplodia corticola TaxID=236234 RepID=A0A1J9S0F4_9PEZI|nr:fmn-dependent dehydrogenase family protein [Diplodia corticola]OJD34055.1 fmn-dependent dehydrogenase family protein [Diplodia corticola]